MAKTKISRDLFKAVKSLTDCESSFDELCGAVGMAPIPVTDQGEVFSLAKCVVGIFTATSALVRQLGPDETRAAVTGQARHDVLDSRIGIPSSLMALLDDAKKAGISPTK